jgi:hypothetical protein
MLARSALTIAVVLAGLGAACALEKGGDGTAAKGAAGDAGGEAGGPTGAGCGAERQTGIQLCIATSQCPTVVVDTQAMPSCGFRIRGSIVDLVCACNGTHICPMGIFTTCREAAKLLTSQTEQQVCLQATEGRCAEAAVPNQTPTNSKNPACDRACLDQCGGGAACASVCNCD